MRATFYFPHVSAEIIANFIFHLCFCLGIVPAVEGKAAGKGQEWKFEGNLNKEMEHMTSMAIQVEIFTFDVKLLVSLP